MRSWNPKLNKFDLNLQCNPFRIHTKKVRPRDFFRIFCEFYHLKTKKLIVSKTKKAYLFVNYKHSESSLHDFRKILMKANN